ncbi:Fusaric acid resistance protein-like [Clostridium cavendishii DSM 21758]|uniref:Fusaric acid resistance protein-like n=1 Tax=Clostridium cavendishii DSM 21758 TaxID=1121302 RepID=A0A1M6Q259_9CLOT|nr:FUSC family protein [Clostridium cavendishii]SHK14302.1 Fusaric acid resistance protein-like [Clostridium cavendishii DSM 21758]
MNDILKKVGFDSEVFIKQLMIGAPIIIIFGLIGGKNSLMLAIPFFMGSLMLGSRNFSIKPFRKFLSVLIIGTLVTMLASLAKLDSFIGIMINLIMIFFVVFIFVSIYEMSLYLPIIYYIAYLELLPIGINDLKSTLILVLIGTMYVSLIQVIIFKNSFSKAINKGIKDEIRLLEDQIENIIKGTYNEEIYKKNIKSVKNLSLKIYSYRYKNNLSTNLGRIYFGISVIIEGFNEILNDLNKFQNINIDNYLKDFLINFKVIFSDIDLYLNKEIGSEIFEKKLVDFCEKYKDTSVEYYHIHQVLNLLKLSSIHINQYISLDKAERQGFKQGIKVNKNIFFTNIKENFNLKSLNFRFALRMSLILSFSIFLVSYYKAPKTLWLPITVLVIMKPFFEDTLSKSFERVKGTILGLIILSILLEIFKGNDIRIVIAILSIFIGFGFLRYDRAVIFYTIGSVLMASFTMGIYEPIIYRFLYVALGVIMVILANKFILPYRIINVIEFYKAELIDLNIELFDAVIASIKGIIDEEKIREILFKINLNSSRIYFYNAKIQNNMVDDLVFYNVGFIQGCLNNIISTKKDNLILENEDFQFIRNDFSKLFFYIEKHKDTKEIRENINTDISGMFLKAQSIEDKLFMIGLSNIFIATKYLEDSFKVV